MVSDAMRPWSIPGDYDRPIPRRILEEAGLPRTSFGIKKYASSHISLNKMRSFSEESWNHYSNFVKQLADGDDKASYLFWRAVTANRHIGWKALNSLSNLVGNKYGARMVRSSLLQRRFPFILNARPLPVPFPFGFIFQWSFSLLKDRYRLPDSIKRTGVEQKTNITKHI